MKVSTIGFVVVDARERIAALDALREGASRIFRGTSKPIPVSLTGCVAAMIILDVNEAAVRMLCGAASRADMIGQRTQRFFDPSCTAQIKTRSRVRGRGTSFQQQARSVRMDGSRFDTLFCVVPKADGTTLPASGLPPSSTSTEHVQAQTSLERFAMSWLTSPDLDLG